MIPNALKPLIADERDFKLGSLFPSKVDVPLIDFEVGKQPILQQGDTQFCTCFATTTASAFQEGVQLSPEFQVAKVNQAGTDILNEGADLRTACKTLVSPGSLEKQESPFQLGETDPVFIADYRNWDSKLDLLAQKHAKDSYASVNGYEDTFSSIQAHLWQNKSAVVTGMKFRFSWIHSVVGIIPEQYEEYGSGHAFVWVGQKVINGVPYLKAQLSNGTDIGDSGYFYFPKSVVNKEATFGNFAFIDLDPEHGKILTKWNLSAKWLWLAKLILYIFK